MPRFFWIPVSVLGMGVATIGILSLRRSTMEEPCATCLAAGIDPHDLKPAVAPPNGPGVQDQPDPPRPTPCGPVRAVVDDDESPDFSGVGIELLRTRHLAKLPSHEERVSPEDLRSQIEKSLRKLFPDGYGVKEGQALVALGAITTPVDTVARRAAIWSTTLGAWYAPDVDRMLLVQSDDDVLPRQHPLGQAFAFLLRERAGWLKKDATVPTTDAWLARLGLLAGDAELTKILHGMHGTPEALHGLAAAEPRDFMRDLDRAVFGAGENFAKALHHLGEWDQVNAAYERPPVTTAELVDAGLYFSEHQFEPRRVSWPDLEVAGHEPFWDDALGQLGARVYLLHEMPPEKTDAVFGRWEGDRWLAYDAGAGKRGHVAWQTVWHDAWAANQFFAAMQQRVQAGNTDPPAGLEDKGLWRWTGGGRTVILARTDDGRGVFYADAAAPEFAEALRAKFLKP